MRDACQRDRYRLGRTRVETLQAGGPVFYVDSSLKIGVMEKPDGTRYEIRYMPGAPGDRNSEIIR